MTQYLDICKSKIETKLQWHTVEEWTHSDFEKLSNQIFNETGIQISRNTLKRVWGKMDYDFSPSKSTLNALSIFCGYKNWSHLCQSIDNQKKKTTISKLSLFVMSILLLMFALLYFFVIQNKNQNYPYEFYLEKISHTLPSSVSFRYNINSLPDNEVYLRYGSNYKQKLKKDEQFIAIQHFMPGIYSAKIESKKFHSSEIKYSIKSYGWLCFVNNENEMKRIYLPIDSGDVLTISEDKIKFHGIDYDTEKNWIRFLYVDSFNVPLNIIDFSCSIKNLEQKAFPCYNNKILLYGTNGNIEIHLSQWGCESQNYFLIGNNITSGDQEDISSLSTDFKEWNRIRIHTTDNKMNVYINDSLKLSKELALDLGVFSGMAFSSRNFPLIKQIYISNNSKKIYEY